MTPEQHASLARVGAVFDVVRWELTDYWSDPRPFYQIMLPKANWRPSTPGWHGWLKRMFWPLS